MDEKKLTGKELKLYQAEQRLKKQRAALVEARRKRDTHVKCQVAGKLFNIFGVSDLALHLDTFKQADALVNACFEMLDSIAKHKDFVEPYSAKIKEAVAKVVDDEEAAEQAKRAGKKTEKEN